MAEPRPLLAVPIVGGGRDHAVLEAIECGLTPAPQKRGGCAKASGNANDYRAVPRRKVVEHVRAHWVPAAARNRRVR
jgi:hypothetical protein